jgi:hypothetical protein
MHMQFLGVAVVVCKSEHQGIKKAKERQCKSLRETVLKIS